MSPVASAKTQKQLPLLASTLAAVALLLGLLAALDRINLFLPEVFRVWTSMAPAVLLYLLGFREPFVEGGGGAAWLTPWGALLFYGLPAVALLFLAKKHTQKRHDPRDR